MSATPTQPRTPEETLLRPQARVLSTLESDGSRRWLYPRLSTGKFWHIRRIVAYGLIAIFVALPYIQIRGKPAMFLDVVHRHFTLFGFTFLPTDGVLLALFMVSMILGVFFITAVLGRTWCGWACPQTVYMEFLFRPIERLCMGRTGIGGSAGKVAIWRRFILYFLYLLAALFLAHTFLAYFVSVDQLRTWVTQSPAQHPAAFAVMAVTTGLMLFDFCYFREQTCIIACPYGRFQSALLDPNSLVISYDRKRGEPRRGMSKAQRSAGESTHRGDCVDCTLCVQVCPTGIDIREGLQIECIGCAQCIDACNSVMAKIDRPLGLIRYSTQAAMAGGKFKFIRPRIVAYALVLTALLTLLSILIVTKNSFDVAVLRALGRPFIQTDDGQIANILRLKLTNRTDAPLSYRVSLVGHPDFALHAMDDQIRTDAGQTIVEPVEIRAPRNNFSQGAIFITVRITADNGATLDRVFPLLGPMGAATEVNNDSRN
jgi:cytochrome c oxidase accessory protein FixG